VEYANFSTAKLAEVDDRYYYSVSCQSCMRGRRLSLTKLRGLLGDDFPVVKVKTRLKCSTCGSKQLTVAFLAPHQAVGNLAHLFHEQST
jgi:predicted nucleic-acid-binding Zn-ribbon protein